MLNITICFLNLTDYQIKAQEYKIKNTKVTNNVDT